MSQWIGSFQIKLRLVVLKLVLLLPGSWRATLARSPVLTRLYEFFDRAKYEVVSAESAPPPPPSQPTPPPAKKPKPPPLAPTPSPPPRPSPQGIGLVDYDYIEPSLTPEIQAQLDTGKGPLISVIMPVYNTPAKWLRLAIQSVQQQWYPNWELCIADDKSTLQETLDVLGEVDDPRIHIRFLEENRHIAGASNAALAMARGDYVALLDHDDELTPDALYHVAQVIEQEGPEFIYSDEDKIALDGTFCDVHLKSGFSPDQFLAHNYLCHLATIKRELVERVGGFTPGTDGAQDYDLFLKVLEHTQRIAHIPRVLYHWRKIPGSTAAEFGDKSYAHSAGHTALQNAVRRRQLNATVEPGEHPGNYRVRYAIRGEPLVSIIIPFKDRADLLDCCLGAIVERSSWRNFEVIGISNNSEEPETFAAMQAWAARDKRIRFVEHNRPFNFSELNNFAVREHARGEHLVLLNNDVEIITADWLESLLEFSQRPDVGVVGARLYFPDGRLQHAGVILGMGGVAGHFHKNLPAGSPGYFARTRQVQNLCAVTAACCMVKRSLYNAVDGLDEVHFRVAFNDVDFCMRLRRAGYLNVYTPYCEALHHESLSRGYEDTPEKKARFGVEVRAFKARFAAELAAGDPYFNPGFALMTQGQIMLSQDFFDRVPVRARLQPAGRADSPLLHQ
jgi:GT2 family glycosyltransferase